VLKYNRTHTMDKDIDVHVYMEKQSFKELNIEINNILTSKSTFLIICKQ